MLPQVRNGEPSRTAVASAGSRAAHLVVDSAPFMFADTVAARLLGGDLLDRLVAQHRQHPLLADTRTRAVARSRYTEDALGAALARGIDQYVILGAGLDSFAYRGAPPAGLRIFEVDHPATQQWKRDRLAAAGIAVPDAVTFVPVDFAVDGLAESLAPAGFDQARPAFVSWLGVTFYLTVEAIAATLAVLGRCAPGTELVCEYNLPPDLRDEAAQRYADIVLPVAEAHGEPWLTSFPPDDLARLMSDNGLTVVQQVAQSEWLPADLWQRTDALRPIRFAMLATAVVGRNPVRTGIRPIPPASRSIGGWPSSRPGRR
jgi:methyltransferase (TIGR00027 family)